MALDTLLLEDGGYLLLEDGGRLLLESATPEPAAPLRRFFVTGTRSRVARPAGTRRRALAVDGTRRRRFAVTADLEE